MRKAKNYGNRLMAMLLSAAMIFAPIFESVPVYAAEAGAEMEGIGTLPEAAPDETVGQTGTEDADDIQLFSATSRALYAASGFSNVGGWNESIYAEIAGVKAADVTEVSWSGTMTGKLGAEDLKYLVRDKSGTVRIDIPGLKAGTYTLNVSVGGQTLKEEGITVYAYDRSGFAHFKYAEGVGAYKDDGTLKENAIVLYVTDENKNTVELSCGGVTVKGIGNILNSVGQDVGGGKTNNGGKANTNQGIIKKLAEAGKPLVVRFIGCVSETGLYGKGTYNAADAGLIDGLTDYSSLDNGGTKGDNGHMARIQSGKDITLEGIGYDAMIDGWGFHYIAEGSAPTLGKSFEVRNLTFVNTPEDAVGMEGQQASKNTSSDLTSSVERCWVHHNEFYCPSITSPAESDKSEGDGSVDFKRGQYFTCSYNYFDSCHKTNLVGSADYSLQFNLTYHHNYWYMCKARGPLARNANIHMYNNVWEMQTDYAQNTRANSYIFSEYNLFYACKSPQAVEGGAIKSYHDSISSVIWNKGNPATVVEDKGTYVSNACQFQARGIKYDKFDTDSALSYIPGNNYTLQTDFDDLRKVIVSQTGVQEQNPKLAEDVAVSEYSVVLKRTTTPNPFDSLPQDLTPGKISKSVYAFTVNASFNLEVTYTGDPGVLVNEAGENLLTGNGGLVNLPAGTYMIQAENFQPGNALKGTIAVFKDMTISSLKITASNPDAHYHKWVLDSSKTEAATCTGTGKKVYTCAADLNGGKCEETKEEVVAALGHAYGAWTIVTPATETEAGEKSRSCTRCGNKETAPIPAGSSGTGGGTGGSGGSTGDTSVGGSTAAGDYVLTFEGKQENDSSDFFTVTGSYSDSKGSTTVNEENYSDCLKMESKTKVSFSCNDGATLFLAFGSSESGKKVKVDGTEYTTDSKGTVTVSELSEGKHEITKGDTINLFYVSVANKASSVVYYTLSFEYNYDDAPDAKTVPVVAGTSYASMSQLVPAFFTRSDYVLDGLYTDASCTTEVAYPYTVNGNATFYADWKESEKQEVTYALIFNSNGGSAVTTVQVSSSQIYTITQRPTRAGYTFAGWYDTMEGGNVVDRIDGSTLTGNITVYAHWNASEKMAISLDASQDFSELLSGKDTVNITEKTTIGGFTIHALAGGVGTAGSENPKYYMTVKEDSNNSNAMGLYTNGVRLTKKDADIEGNEDGLLKSLEFTAEGQGILTVDLALTAAPEKDKQYDLVLARESTEGSLVEAGRASLATTGKKRATKTFDVEEAGTYYLYVEGAKGVVYYNLKLTEQVYTVLYQVGAGTVPAGQESVTAREGEAITLPVCTANPGYTFKGWSMDGGETMLDGSYTVNVDDVTDGVITITAYYDRISYTVNFDANGGTLPEGMTATRSATVEDTLTLGECVPKEGQQFLGWTVNGSSDKIMQSYKVNPADAVDNVITLKAEYADADKVYYTVKFDAGDGTLPETMEASYLKEAEDVVELGACVPPTDKKFVGWSVEGTDKQVTSSYTVKPEDAVEGEDGKKVITLKAVYTEVEKEYYTVKFDAGAGSLPETMEATCQKEADDTVELGACTPPTAAQQFIGWSVEGTDKKVTSSYTVKPEDAKDVDGKKVITLKAVYTEAGKTYYTVKFSAEGGKLPAGMSAVATAEAGDLLTLGECAPPTDDKKFVGWSVNGSTATITSEYKVKAEDADENGIITIKAVYDVKNVKKTGIAIIGLEESYEYTGAKIIPNIGVVDYDVDDGRILAPGVDYSVQYKNNSKAGETATVTVTGKGNYAGKDITGSFKILEVANVVGELADLKGAKLGKIEAVTYNGSAQYPKLTLTLKGAGAVEYTYDETARVYKAADGTTIPANVAFSNNINKGTATVLLTGANDNKNRPTKIKKTFKINAVDISKAAMVVDSQSGTYGAKAASPASITVTCNGVKLKNGTDYTVKYSANTKVTTGAKITITGKGNYTKKYTSATYTINQLNLSETGAGIKAVTAYTGVAAGKVKATVTDKNGNALKASQYTLKVYKDAAGESEYGAKDKLDAGKVYVKAVAKDTMNLTGETSIVEFDVATNIAKAKTELRKDGKKVMTKTYTGQAIELDEQDLTVKVNGVTDPLKRGTDYEIVSYSNNINKGTATAVIKGIGSYSGTKTVKFKIVGKTMKIENNKTTWDDVSSLIKGLFDR